MTAIADPPENIQTRPERLPVVLLGLSELVKLFPVAKFTVYRWNNIREGRRALPDPLIQVSGTPLWTEAQIQEFASQRGYVLEPKVLAGIRKGQGHTNSN